jgi:pyruvate/2-oxoglutarate dehydrogenase complex dihydrolipoamide acyltransferase (E2) component
METVAVTTPNLGAREGVRVSGWLVEVGETVRVGDRLVELLMPGVSYDVAAPATGRLVNVTAAVGTGVRPGDVLGTIAIDEDV